jgi:hypothetical protein
MPNERESNRRSEDAMVDQVRETPEQFAQRLARTSGRQAQVDRLRDRASGAMRDPSDRATS